MYINIHLNIYIKIIATASTGYAQMLLRDCMHNMCDRLCMQNMWGGYD